MDKVWVDIPSGWQYGWPKVWDRKEHPDFEAWLRKMNCPAKLFQMAVRYSRMWPCQDP